mmetsp:Transcript_62231/g.138619  ORF Transcript_62231/g.138619 Transcript_62231/m.138619 type:complete len:232 (-) Transcript_62231:139-834(-)
MHAVIARIRRRSKTERLPLLHEHSTQRSGWRLGRIGRTKHLPTEVSPGQLRGVELHNIVVDHRVGGSELCAHAHEEGVKRVDGRFALHLEQRAVEAAAKLDELVFFFGAFPDLLESVRVYIQLLARFNRVERAPLCKNSLPLLSKLFFELFHGHRKVGRRHKRGLARNRIVVLIDVLFGVDRRPVDFTLGDHLDAHLCELLEDELKHCWLVRVRLCKHERALRRSARGERH